MVAGALAARALIGIPAGGTGMSVTVQLARRRDAGARRVLRRDRAAGGRGELGPARRAAAAAAGEPDLAGDLQFVGDGTFEPMTNVTLTVTPAAPGSQAQCIFDGYVLSWRLHLDRTSTSSTIDIWAQDASWLMNIDDTRHRVVRPDRRRGRQRDLRQLRLHARRRRTPTTTRPATRPTGTRCSSARPTCSSCAAWPGAAASSAASPAPTPRASGPATS